MILTDAERRMLYLHTLAASFAAESSRSVYRNPDQYDQNFKYAKYDAEAVLKALDNDTLKQLEKELKE